ncbi:MAG: type II toxin-antitoxin system Phd/YefM family antitoxin [Egibacteraceae bacterium]
MVLERVTVRELVRQHKDVLSRVEAGESLEITRDGEPIARLIPLDPVERTMAKLIEAGHVRADWRERQARLRDRLRQRPVSPGAPLADVLLRMREEERA